MAPAAKVDLFGLFSVSSFILTCWGITLFLGVSSFLLTRKLRLENPGRVQTVLEMGVGFLNNFCKEQLAHLGKRWRVYAPMLGTFALFLLCCNLAGLFGITPPTKSFAVPLALTLTSILLIYSSQFISLGLFKGLHRFLEPSAILLPLNIMEIAIRTISLCIRLFGNILAASLLMAMLHFLCPVILPAVLGIYFDIFDGLLQMVVFVFLSLLFLAEQTHSALPAEGEEAQ